MARLAHIRAVLAVRLWLQSGQAYQEGRAWWRSERRIRAAAGGRVGIAHLPDAEIHWPSLDGAPYAGQIWAIEAELTPKPLARTTGIMRAMLTRTSDYGPAGTPSIGRPLRPDRLPDRPRRRLDRDPVDRRPPRAVAAPDGRPGPAPGRAAVSIWGWLKLTIAVWLFRQALKLTGWLIAAAVAVAAWPITVVAAVGYGAAWLRGWPPARLWRAACWSLPMTAVYFTGQAPAAAVLARGRAGPGQRLGRCVAAAGRPRDLAGRAAGGPGRGPGRAGDRRIVVGVADLRRHHRPGRADRLRAGLVRRTPVAAPGPLRPRPGRRPRHGAAADRPGPGRGRGDHPRHRAPVAARPGRPGRLVQPPFGDHRLVGQRGRRT